MDHFTYMGTTELSWIILYGMFKTRGNSKMFCNYTFDFMAEN